MSMSNLMPNLLHFALLTLMLWAFEVRGTPKDKPSRELPVIQKYSELDTELVRGDTLQLSVDAVGGDLQYTWNLFHENICSKAECLFDTITWAVGRHKLTLNIANENGSKTLVFNIKVKEKIAFSKPSAVIPKILSADPQSVGEPFWSEDFFVSSLTDIGYWRRKNQAVSVGPERSPLTWSGTLSTHPASTLHFGRPKQEDHYVLPSSAILIDEEVEENQKENVRSIRIDHGTLRSRILDDSEPAWIIKLNDTLTLKPGVHSDLIVTIVKTSQENENQEDITPQEIQVIVLRGTANLVFSETKTSKSRSVTLPVRVAISIKESEEKKPEALTDEADVSSEEFHALSELNQPLHMLMPQYFNNPEDPLFVIPDESLASSVIHLTTPEYFLSRAKGASVKEALTSARQLIAKKDFFSAIEVLLPYRFLMTQKATKSTKKNAKSQGAYNVAYELGLAYYGVFLFKEARECFDQARRLNPDAPEPYFFTGLMYAESKTWDEAITWFDQARKRDFDQGQWLHYVTAVSYAAQNRHFWAEQNFSYSLWDTKWNSLNASPENSATLQNKNNTKNMDRSMAKAAKRFINSYNRKKLATLSGELGVLYDSNIFRIPEGEEPPIEIRHRGGTGNAFKGRVKIEPFQDPSADFSLLFEVSRIGYFKPALKKAGVSMFSSGFDFSLTFGQPKPATEPTESNDDPDREDLKTLFSDEKNIKSVNSSPWIKLRTKPFFGMVWIGSASGKDFIGIELEAASPRLPLKPAIQLTDMQNFDPVPDQGLPFDPTTHEVSMPSSRTNRDQVYGLSVVPYETNWFFKKTTSKLLLERGQLKYRREDVHGDDFTYLKFTGSFLWQILLRTSLDSSLFYVSKTFPSASDGRKDTGFGLDLSWKWQFMPALYQVLQGQYELTNSSRGQNSYARYFSQLSYVFEF